MVINSALSTQERNNAMKLESRDNKKKRHLNPSKEREKLNKGKLRGKDCVHVCVKGSQVCKIKVLAPQSVRVQRESDECSKGDDEESGLKRRKEIISVEASLRCFFIFRGQLCSSAVCPQSHSFCIVPKLKKILGVSWISQSPNWFSGT